ncbi:GntR family transcriptional regulator [Paremcibacter congregatus]|uniref:GntR family transcriptional regulator n=1 Tax=Paremcibacter congregatus TaxID=2043170 RepID=A0A2G4YQX1_9PROT|nr:GntR family transcriptional regulator [Paremcibacter congregatus]PHZ84680.1 GntR family transcriptional regulator [Paremcibacter congregatus]QDE28874.1 GntR family transcriptional regulator [Paremcibacter congregatus]
MKLERITPDKSTVTPLYIQIANNIRTYITDHNVEVGEALPPERDLCHMTGTSRVTIRKALNKLAEDKIVQRRQGAGTFVLPRVEHLGSNLSGFTDNALNQGLSPQAIWIMKTYGSPTAEEAEILKISQTDKVARFGRVRLSDNHPLAIEHAVVPAKLLPNISDISESLYQALESMGNHPVTGTQRVRASLANPTEAGLLSVAENSEVLRIERRSYLEDGTPVELTRSAYRGDHYDIVMNLENIE